MKEDESRRYSQPLIAQVSRLADLVSYQAGAVVSRTLIDKGAGTVTLFAFAVGQGLSEHTAPYDTLIYVINGETNITISGKTVRLKDGDMTVMPANEPHSLRAIIRSKMMLIMIKS
jgi:quercetin dioxygenase-like cupin family protein